MAGAAFGRIMRSTSKTAIAFQIAWALFQSRWNLSRKPERRPRILFLADRNILADQAYNSFAAFPEDALARIKPDEIRKKGRVPKNATFSSRSSRPS
jgi:type I restriction enzyme R subunit